MIWYIKSLPDGGDGVALEIRIGTRSTLTRTSHKNEVQKKGDDSCALTFGRTGTFMEKGKEGKKHGHQNQVARI
jgi:hypothetical protein